jgi:hypothetical protein
MHSNLKIWLQVSVREVILFFEYRISNREYRFSAFQIIGSPIHVESSMIKEQYIILKSSLLHCLNLVH